MSYTAEVEADAPYAWYRMDAASGTTETDLGSGKHNGTYSGTFTLKEPGVLPNSEGDYSVGFTEGEGKGGHLAATGGAVSKAWSVEAWISIPTGNAGGANQNMIISTRQGGGDQSCDIAVLSSGALHADIGSGSAWLTTSADTAAGVIELNKVYHVVLVATEAGWKWYVNGALKTEGAYSGVPLLWDGTHTFQVGQLAASAQYHAAGRIDDVAIYTTALSAARIKAHYEVGIVSEAPELTNPGTQWSLRMGVALQLHAVNTNEYKATGLPKGLTLNSATGKITGTPNTLETTTVNVTLKGGKGGIEEVTRSFPWIIEDGGVFPPTVLIDPLERTESPISSGGKWKQNSGGVGTEGPGKVTPEGWTPTDNKGGSASPPISYGCYWSPQQFVGPSACVTIRKEWIEEASAEIPSGENSFALYVDYTPGKGGYALVIGESPASGSAALPPGAVRGEQRVQFVYVTPTGADVQAGERHFPQAESIEAVGISASHEVLRVWVRIAGIWSIAVRKTKTEIEAAGYVWYTEGYLALEALGQEGRAAQLFAWAQSEEAVPADAATHLEDRARFPTALADTPRFPLAGEDRARFPVALRDAPINR